jgi:4-amino-4-deoxy-L-arabinose transferase-like glycosyltransferase
VLTSNTVRRSLPYVFLALFFGAAFLFRPLLPIDETRYLTVAWEMYLRKSFAVPTLNFEPYFQKPPLLFWLIDLAWSVFGVSRLAALGVMFAVSSLVIYLTGRLARSLFEDNADIASRIPWLMLGNVVFVIYSTMILFDLLLTVFVLASMLSLLAFARGRGLRYAVAAGLFVGLGVLTKGPVTLLHIGWPILLYPLWRNPSSDLEPKRFLAGAGLSLAVACLPVFVWLVPAIYQTSGGFAYNLVWKQAAGRVSGNLQSSHARPFYFYLLLAPILLLPWVLAPQLWRSNPFGRLRKNIESKPGDRRALRLLVAWSVGVVLVFSAISGKQPHYLVPILPLVSIIIAYLMVAVPLGVIRNTAVSVLVLCGVGQAVASVTVFDRFNLNPLADFIDKHPGAAWAFNGNYQGELTFLARLEKPLTIVEGSAVEAWLASHPDGYVIRKLKALPPGSERLAFTHPFQGGYFVVETAPRTQSEP